MYGDLLACDGHGTRIGAKWVGLLASAPWGTIVTSVLIPTRGNDPDATYVAAAIRLKGHDAQLWLTADYPTRQSQNFSFDGKSIQSTVSSPLAEFDLKTFDTIWLRRPTWPYSGNLSATDEDQTYYERRADGII